MSSFSSRPRRAPRRAHADAPARVPGLGSLVGLVAGLLVSGWATPAHAARLGVEGGLERGVSLLDWLGLRHLVWEISMWVEPHAARPCGSGIGHALSFAVLGLVVVAALRFRHSIARQRLELARRIVDRGLEPPEELLGTAADHDLRRGCLLVATGVGLTVYSFLSAEGAPSAAGMIPAFIGVGYLVSHALSKRSRSARGERGERR